MTALPNVPVSNEYGSRGRRRAHVVTLYAGYAAFLGLLVSEAAVDHTSPLRWLILAGALAAFFAFANSFFVLLRRTLINAPNISDSALDEREVAMKNTALRKAYFTLTAIVLLEALALFIASTWRGDHPIGSGILQALLWTNLLITTTLPTTFLAWTLPDADNER